MAAATPYWVMPERMAALRMRYPGAPEHWLELLARRTNIADLPQTPAFPAEPEARHDGPRPRFAATEPSSPSRPPPRGSNRPTGQPVPRFPAPARRSSVTARPGVAADDAARSSASQAAGSTARRQGRPTLTFGVARIRNPIANLLRGKPRNERAASPRFPFEDAALRTDQVAQPALHEGGDERRERVTAFPEPEPQSAHRPEWIGPRDQPARPRDSSPGWPEFRYSAPPGPSWPSSSSRHERFNPRFAEPDNRWPELPAFLDEPGPSVGDRSDEAALLAEHLGGTWSA